MALKLPSIISGHDLFKRLNNSPYCPWLWYSSKKFDAYTTGIYGTDLFIFEDLCPIQHNRNSRILKLINITTKRRISLHLYRKVSSYA